jgi:UDP-GlcNAc:undecaprenyl-phosphate/decaprenyl-phosphate GlcNAc-1-phosphate transferase
MSSEMPKEHYFFEFAHTRSAYLRWALVVCAGFLGGVAGVLSVFIAQAMLKLGGDDSAAKHGISKNHASRLGGVVVFGFVLLSYVWYFYGLGQNLIDAQVMGIFVAGACFFFLGLFEDLKGLLKANVRFVAMVAIVAVFLLLRPEFILQTTGLSLLDGYLLSYEPIAFVFTMFGVVFMVNAFNTADGANGLISGVTLMACVGLIQHGLGFTGGLLALIGLGCGIFMLFNVVIGRIFLGDGGAYFLGAALSLTLVTICNNGIESPWYLLSLVFYPHADLLFSMVRRKGAGKAIFGADNGHLHNLIYRRLSSITKLAKQANTITGLLVAFVFGALPLLIWNLGLKVDWLWIYCFQWFLYAASWGLLADRLTRDVDTKDWATPIKL